MREEIFTESIVCVCVCGVAKPKPLQNSIFEKVFMAMQLLVTGALLPPPLNLRVFTFFEVLLYIIQIFFFPNVGLNKRSREITF